MPSHEYLVSYAFKSSKGHGHGNTVVTAEKPLTAADIPFIEQLIRNNTGMLTAEIVLLAISKF